MDDKKNLDVLKTQIPELDENCLESIWDINPLALVLRVRGLVPRECYWERRLTVSRSVTGVKIYQLRNGKER
jgi:hypothetical protein